MRDNRCGAEITVQSTCSTHWSTGIVHGTCGHLMKDVLQKTRSASHPCWICSPSRTFTSAKAGHTVTGTGRKKVAKNSTAKQLQRRCRKKHCEHIHDRFIRDKWFRKTMIELGRIEEIIFEMDRFASENHSHIATKAEIDVYRGNWWIRSTW